MAARRWQEGFGSLYHNPVTLWCHIVSGVAGAVASFGGRGITSVTKLGAGRYRLLLSDAYRGLLMCDAMCEAAANNVDTYAQLEAEAVATAAAPTVDIKVKTAGVSTDLANGDDMWVRLDLMNSNVDVVI